MSEFLTIIDISRYQGVLDAEKAKAAGAVGVIVRATVGDYYTDAMFRENFDRAKDAGLLAGAYHVFNPICSAVGQIQRFIDAIGARVVDIPHTMDVEVSAGQNKYTITTNLKACMPYVPRVRGRLPNIYTRAGWWNEYIYNDGTDWTIYPLHVANYTTAPAPILPYSWDTWWLWQWSADGNGLGDLYGVESDSVDLNRYGGSLSDLYKFCGIDAPLPPPPVPVFPCLMRSRGDWRPMRTGPTTIATFYGSLSPLLTVMAYQEVAVGADRWVRLSESGTPEVWTARLYNGLELMRFV